jgi:diguanylate cyclase (GGDEF)-like protein
VPADALLAAIGIAITLNLVVMAVLVVPPLVGRRSPLAPLGEPDMDAPDLGALERAAMVGGMLGESPEAQPRAYDRVVRIVSWAFLLATAAVVFASGLWPDTGGAIIVLLALAAVFLVIVHDLLPTGVLGPAKYVLEGTVAITFATFLVLLTGGHQSPFFFVFPLIVGGAALVVRPAVTLVLTFAAAIGYLLAAALGAGTPSAIQLAAVVINLTALCLLAYVGSVIGREQRRVRDAAIRLSAVDSLTGLFNRAFFYAALDREIARSARSGRGFGLLMLDVDELKEMNDRYGHHVGDLALTAVGETIRTGVRSIDVPARYGGDEFVALLPETDPAGGFVLAEKIRRGINERKLPGVEVALTVSVGVVAYPLDGDSADTLMVSADRAMYESKRGGKNRVEAPSVIGAGRVAVIEPVPSGLPGPDQPAV